MPDPDARPAQQTLVPTATTVAAADTEAIRHRVDLFGRMLDALPDEPIGPALIYQVQDQADVKSVALGTELVVGRKPESGEAPHADVLAFPESERMSRRHFRIRREQDFFMLTDLASANGTFVNTSAAPVQEHWLNAGDIILAGNVIFAFTGD